MQFSKEKRDHIYLPNTLPLSKFHPKMRTLHILWASPGLFSGVCRIQTPQRERGSSVLTFIHDRQGRDSGLSLAPSPRLTASEPQANPRQSLPLSSHYWTLLSVLLPCITEVMTERPHGPHTRWTFCNFVEPLK